MINLNNFERRIAALEITPERTQIDPFSEALKALDVTELGLCQWQSKNPQLWQ